VFRCGWATFPLGLLLDCGSADFGCAKTVVEAHKMKMAVRPMILRDMLHLQQTQTLSDLSATASKGHQMLPNSRGGYAAYRSCGTD